MIIKAFCLLLFIAAVTNRSYNDRALSRRIRDGDHKAFKKFFDMNYQSLYRLLISRGLDKATTEDLIQKAFVIIWEKRDHIDEEKSLRAYLFRTAYTRMLNEIKYNSRFDDEAVFPQPEGNQSPEDQAHYSHLLKTIHEVIARMPKKRSMVFNFCFLQQYSYKETAEAMEISLKTVENHMGLALKDVRMALNKFRPEKM